MSVAISTPGTIESGSTGNLGALTGRNKLVNPFGRVNQRRVSGTVNLGPGAFGHDHWRGGAAGCSYTFAFVDGDITFTIVSGSLVQPVQAGFMRGGKMVLSWEGTSQGKISGGAYGNSGVNADCAANVQASVEFGPGTMRHPQFEQGTQPTPTEPRLDVLEMFLCRHYARYWWGQGVWGNGQTTGVQNAAVVMSFDPPMYRAVDIAINGICATNAGGGPVGANTAALGLNTADGITVNLGFGAAVWTAGGLYTIITGASAGSFMGVIAELP